jgi:hypothetical protein
LPDARIVPVIPLADSSRRKQFESAVDAGEEVE